MEKENKYLNMIKLNSIKYTFWKTIMENILYNKDLYDLIEGETKLKEKYGAQL